MAKTKTSSAGISEAPAVDKTDKEIIVDLQQQLTDKDAENETLKEDISAKDETIADLQKQLTDRDAENETLKGDISVKDETISDLQQQLKDKNAENETLKNDISAKDDEIEDLMNKWQSSIDCDEVNSELHKPTYKGYQFIVDNFRFKGVKHKSEDAIKDNVLMDSLIEAKFYGLKKID
ncbi:MAG: epoxide hydrolase N-terminal domain-containing protein [Tenacibaculum sp.]|nr:epoxide hydrolase N-terminal domain-containing protein [Tenacibaculum sp.]